MQSATTRAWRPRKQLVQLIARRIINRTGAQGGLGGSTGLQVRSKFSTETSCGEPSQPSLAKAEGRLPLILNIGCEGRRRERLQLYANVVLRPTFHLLEAAFRQHDAERRGRNGQLAVCIGKLLPRLIQF